MWFVSLLAYALPSALLMYALGALVVYKLRLTKITKIAGFFIAWPVTAITALLMANETTILSAEKEIFPAATIGAIIAVFGIALAGKRNLLEGKTVLSGNKPLPESKSIPRIDKTYPWQRFISIGFIGSSERLLLIAITAILIIMLAYPPFQLIVYNGAIINMGYGWIFDPPNRGALVASVNLAMLLVQWIGVLLVGGIVYFLIKNSPQK
jgi:hypothetical protein